MQYMKEVRKVIVVDVQNGSLILILECSSLQILDELWEDYCTGHLNEVAQKFLVTDEILKEFGLAEVKLTTTINEEEYKACRELLLNSSKNQSSVADNLYQLGTEKREQQDIIKSAHEFDQRSPDIRIKLVREEHQSTADWYYKVGITQHNRGDFKAALQSKQRALEIRIKLFGEEHKSTADCYYSLG
ncbi:unnamed protein product [Porites lobata]|uniref:TRADD-like N-terminal domain-containing protein n=1 Tax=Porites lobata TaxID=104759 RepID=A0ABN8PFV0_9CNID|nr:unnamed protein product [Porites lobata]